MVSNDKNLKHNLRVNCHFDDVMMKGCSINWTRTRVEGAVVDCLVRERILRHDYNIYIMLSQCLYFKYADSAIMPEGINPEDVGPIAMNSAAYDCFIPHLAFEEYTLILGDFERSYYRTVKTLTPSHAIISFTNKELLFAYNNPHLKNWYKVLNKSSFAAMRDEVLEVNCPIRYHISSALLEGAAGIVLHVEQTVYQNQMDSTDYWHPIQTSIQGTSEYAKRSRPYTAQIIDENTSSDLIHLILQSGSTYRAKKTVAGIDFTFPQSYLFYAHLLWSNREDALTMQQLALLQHPFTQHLSEFNITKICLEACCLIDSNLHYYQHLPFRQKPFRTPRVSKFTPFRKLAPVKTPILDFEHFGQKHLDSSGWSPLSTLQQAKFHIPINISATTHLKALFQRMKLPKGRRAPFHFMKTHFPQLLDVLTKVQTIVSRSPSEIVKDPTDFELQLCAIFLAHLEDIHILVKRQALRNTAQARLTQEYSVARSCPKFRRNPAHFPMIAHGKFAYTTPFYCLVKSLYYSGIRPEKLKLLNLNSHDFYLQPEANYIPHFIIKEASSYSDLWFSNKEIESHLGRVLCLSSNGLRFFLTDTTTDDKVMLSVTGTAPLAELEISAMESEHFMMTKTSLSIAELPRQIIIFYNGIEHRWESSSVENAAIDGPICIPAGNCYSHGTKGGKIAFYCSEDNPKKPSEGKEVVMTQTGSVVKWVQSLMKCEQLIVFLTQMITQRSFALDCEICLEQMDKVHKHPLLVMHDHAIGHKKTSADRYVTNSAPQQEMRLPKGMKDVPIQSFHSRINCCLTEPILERLNSEFNIDAYGTLLHGLKSSN
jgi:hypothetical protein